MADRIRSVDFLPEIFQTPTNRKFLNSTLDQLIQEPKLKQTQGYIGRRNAPGKSPTDGYVVEPTEQRTQYQLEPGVIFKDNNGNTVDALTYTGLIDGLETAGARVDNHDRLFSSETYSWSPFIDFDKFVNYSQYYWLPNGPASVNVSAASVFLTNDFQISAVSNKFSIDGFPLGNPDITVLRGGTYNFEINQPGSAFYIQTQPGDDGVMPWADNISSREVLGVVNNGADTGTITFNVPVSTAQAYYHSLPNIGGVDLATTSRMNLIADQLIGDVRAILGIQNIESKTLVFLDDTPGNAATLGWINNSLPVIAQADRYQIYRIQLDVVGSDTFVRLVPTQPIANNERFTIQYGDLYSNVDFFKNTSGFFERVPLETASLDTLYYQDASNPNRVGVINVVDQNSAALLDVSDIISAKTYTSPNGVIFTNGMKVQFRGDVSPVEYTDMEYYVEGVGTAIRLTAVTDLLVPESFAKSFTAPWDIVAWDTEGLDNTLNAPVDHDYITINRSSSDTNAWSRSNRWFHIDVIKASADYNGAEVNLDNTDRAARPIIEFDADLRLFNYGTESKKIIDVIDFNTQDALSDVNGATSYTVDGFPLSDGTRVIFANDTDLTVRDKIYTVEKVDPNNDGIDTINLVLAVDSDNEKDNIVILGNGLTMRGLVYTYDGSAWNLAQAKTSVNQPPLFDIFDASGKSLSDFPAYPSTTFTGTKLFSYAVGTGTNDPVLGFPLTYLNIDNLGDIVFDNNLYTDRFLYVEDNVSNENTPIHTASLRKYFTRTEFTTEFGWTTSLGASRQPQIIDIIYAGDPIVIDVLPATDLLIPNLRITADGEFINSTNYTVNALAITFATGVIETGADVQIKVISDEISNMGYYEVPTNLSSNMFNENTSLLTLGTVRNHYNKLSQNILEFTGSINGANNIRDLGDVSKYGTLIVQQSSPVAAAATFIRNREYNFFSSVELASQQYEKFKNQLIDWVEKHDVFGLSPADIIDAAIKDINVGKTADSAYYWSDMLPTGSDFETTTYTVTAISTDTYTTLRTYDFLNANTQALSVYFNGRLLVKDLEYTVATDGPRITLLIAIAPGDIIKIDEYETTLGANVPSTPTKLGLFPRYRPEIFVDNTYVDAVTVIRGHDGSITTSFGKSNTGDLDIRDLVLLEFEKRVYNNIKVNADLPIEMSDIIPGEFRTTDYTTDEITDIMSTSLLSWVGWNRIDYKTQDYIAAEEKTWNYSSATSKTTGTLLEKANWRGIYLHFYDTDAPHERPWEMLGMTERPDWWVSRYGEAPYTSGNLVLWDDIETGMIREPGNEYVATKFVRPGLSKILPVDGEGNLLMPLHSIISSYTEYDFKKSWKIGDVAPAEAAWQKSSAWPFAIQRLYALTKPAQYFSLMADRDRYAYNATIGQYLYDGSSRLDTRSIEIQDTNLVKHSYINWIIDYNRYYGYESVSKLKDMLSNLDVNLCHRMASFTDKNNLKIFTDKSSPDSTNSSLLLPDESYNLLLYKNQPTNEVIYSSIIVQKVANGYAVIGNSSTTPYFKIQTAVATGKQQTISAASTTIGIPVDFNDGIEFIPYGYVFSSKQAVGKFIVSYNEYLLRQGMKFNTYENTNPVDWTQMIQEFLYWSDQGWADNSIINLNPAAAELEFEKELFIVDDLNNLELTDQPLDQNKQPLDISNYTIDRIENNFKIRMLDNNIISYLKFNLTSFEHLLVLDNTSIFNDLIYDPVTGVRQQRVKLSGFTTYEWNGQLDAQGFLYNEDNVKDWTPTNTYNKGDIIKFKNTYWSAADKIQPAETFNFNEWAKTNYDQINKGLLPNIATKADQMLRYYNNKSANLESDIDLLAYGLTGFRARDYLRSLDLDDISQVNIYGDMIANKGTAKSLNLFKDVELNNEKVDYTIFENWALRRARYGATSNRNYIELQLDADSLPSNPSLVEIVHSRSDASVSDMLIPVTEIYKQSVKHTNTNIFPVRTARNLDIALPSAGFVNPSDVDLSIFDIAELNTLGSVNEGNLIWVAKDTAADWNVYRTIKLFVTVIKVNDNLDGTITLVTNAAHNLVVGDIITVHGIDEHVDGTVQVAGIFDDVNIIVPGELAQNQTCILDVVGALLQFVSARVEIPSDIANSKFDNNVNTSETIWVLSDDGKSSTYKKENPFTPSASESNPAGTITEYSQSIAQGYNNAGLLVGDPAANVVHFYDKTSSAEYIFNKTMTIANPGVVRYGDAVALISSYGAISAPGDATTPGIVAVIDRSKSLGLIQEVQLLTSPNISPSTADGFGSSIAMSQDENWIFVGEPTNNQVHTYQRTAYEIQDIEYVSDGVTQIYSIANSINVSAGNELSVVVDNVALVYSVDYTYNAANSTISLTTIPAPGVVITIARNNSVLHNGTGFTASFSAINLYAFTDAASISVTVDGVLQIPSIDYTVVGTNVIFAIVPPPGVGNVAISITQFRYVSTIDETSVNETFSSTERFGEAIDISANSSQIAITAPGTDGNVGTVYMLDRVVERFVISNDTVLSYTTNRTPLGSVFNNGIQLVKEGFNLSPEYSISGNVVTIENNVITIGDFLDVDTTEFKLLQKVSAETPTPGATFGNAVSICKSKCSVYIGAENDLLGQGSVTRYINTSRMYGSITSTVLNPTIATGSTIRINNVEVALPVTAVVSASGIVAGVTYTIVTTGSTDYTKLGAADNNPGTTFTSKTVGTGTGTVQHSSDAIADAINAVTIPNVTALSIAGKVIIELVNKEINSLANKLDVLPGTQISLADIGFDTYTLGQTITSPTDTAQPQYFGSSVHIDLNLNQLAIGARAGDAIYNNNYTVDNDGVTVDASLTVDAATTVTATGTAYTYDLLSDGDIFTGGKLVFGQQVVDGNMSPGDSFGSVVNLVDGVLVVSSPSYSSGIGRISIFENATNSLSWTATTVQNEVVDIDLINSVYIYDSNTLNVSNYLDYIDPLNGKILGAARQNIDLITVYDPAVYDTASNGLLWGRAQIDKIWWDISTVRFMDYNLGDAKLSSKLWGKVFPGSSIDMYQWTESAVPPESYVGTGTVLSVDKYVTIAELDKSGIIQNTYFFWVNKVETISVNSNKSLSASAIASYIESPSSSGISFAAFIAPNIIGLYNSKDIITNTNSVLYVEYDKTKNSNNVFVEYDLFRENHPTDFLSDRIYKKLQDSLCGVDLLGNLVPDNALTPAARFGIEFRPRQSMFVDRYAALSSYMKKVNGILAEHTVAETRAYPLLNSQEPEPSVTSGVWDQKVLNAEELSFQDITIVPAGYKYLVMTDENNNGLWAIYEVTAVPALLLIQLQGYDTTRFWTLAHWYATDFNPFTKIDYVVNEISGLSALLNVENNAVAKVLSNSVGSWEIHQLVNDVWERVALENGTIQFDERLWDYSVGRYGFDVEVFAAQNFDEEPVTELRQILRSINEELLIGNLTVERSKVLLSVFNYVLAEQPHVDWLYKTSMIDVTQKVRSLAQYAVYQKDNQDYLIDYLKEAKPYHTKIKDFLLSYDGLDLVDGHVTDFDCPSTFSEEFDQYISPVLDDGATLVTDPSNKLATDAVWQTDPWKQWFDNYLLSVGDVIVTNPGSGYTIAPRVVVTGSSTAPAVMTSVLGPGGTISSINIVDTGSGYKETPVITFEGGNGTGATATARMENTLVRTFLTTIKYDRYEYESKIADFAINDVTTTRNLVFKYNSTLNVAATTGEIPTLYRVTELYTDADDNDFFDITKFEEVPYFTTLDGSRVYTAPTADATVFTGPLTADTTAITVDAANGLDDIEQKYLKEGIARWYELEDALGQPSGVFHNENNNSESRNFVRYAAKVYKLITFDDTSEFSATKYEEVAVDSLGAADRTTGYYVSDVNNPGLDLSLLINGIAFPGVSVDADNFTVTDAELDAIYASDFLDTYLGTRPTDINVSGSEFIDTFHSHAPDELVPGSIFDTLDIKVFSRPGSDYLKDGHAFAVNGKVFRSGTSISAFSFENIVDHPIRVMVADLSTGKMLYEGLDFQVDWPNQKIVFNTPAVFGSSVFGTSVFGMGLSVPPAYYGASYFGSSYFGGTGTTVTDIKVFVYEIGGGNQLHRNAFTGNDVVGSTFNVPVRESEIFESIIFVNGVRVSVTTSAIDLQTTAITLPSPPAATDFITATIFGFATPQYQESYPVVQTSVAGATVADAGAELFDMYRENAIVEVNGLRLRPPEGARYVADGTVVDFMFPLTGGFLYDSVADSEVTVYINGERQELNVDFTVSPAGATAAVFGSTYFGTAVFNSGSANIPRWITFITPNPPAASDIVSVYVRTAADYWWTGTIVDFATPPSAGSLVAITTFKDDSELDMLTQVFVGPTTVAEAVSDLFDDLGFDASAFDFQIGVNSSVNLFDLTRETRESSLWVTLNGERLHANIGYQIVGNNQLLLTVPVISSTDVLVVTSITDNVITSGSEFRLFKDMRDTVGMYRIADTVLTQDLLDTDDIIYVSDASVLGKPDLATGVFGILLVNGERITYRTRDLVNNTVSGLRRGTAGTAIDPLHTTFDVVYDSSAKNLVQWDYNQIWYASGISTASNGTPLQDQTTSPALFIKN